MTINNQNTETELRLLLVDDEVDFVETLADSLRLQGLVVETALDAAGAIATQEAFSPDIALVDIRLGQDNGLELVAKFNDIDPELICVMVTAYSDADSAIRALKSGAYDYLSKPFHPDELLAVIDRCAEKRRLLRDNRAAIKSLQESEQNYRRLSQQFETLLDGITDALLLMSKDCKVVWANRGAGKQFGRPDEDLAGLGCEELWNRAGELCSKCIRDVVRTGAPQELMHKMPDV